jgi:hypothetical protein
MKSLTDVQTVIITHTHTHTHTHDMRIIRVTSPLSLSPQSCCFPRGFPTNLLSRPHIPCLLLAEPVLDLSILIIDYLNKPLELPIMSYPRCWRINLCRSKGRTFLFTFVTGVCNLYFSRHKKWPLFILMQNRWENCRFYTLLVLFYAINSWTVNSFEFVYLSGVLRELNQLYLPLFA